MKSERMELLKAKYAAEEAAANHHEHLKQQIKDALTIGQLHHVSGRTRWSRRYDDFEPWYESLAREVRVIKPPGWTDEWLWGRETWMKRRNSSLGKFLIAWTEDKNGHIVRGWYRHRTANENRTANEMRAYDTPGNRSCPNSGAWMPSVLPGQLTFPAFPFLLHLNKDPDPRVAETVHNLLDICPVGSFR